MNNYPFITPTTGGSKKFKVQKAELKALNYPTSETSTLIDTQYDKIIKPLHSKFKDHLLIKMPSGSGQNKIVDQLISKLAAHTNTPILDDSAFQKLHSGEAKSQLNPKQRAENPIHFQPNPSFDFTAFRGKKAFIIDDVLSTGESSVRLAQAVEVVGIKVEGIAALVTVEKRKPSERDFQRVADKLSMVTKQNKTIIVKNLNTAFAPYTRQRLNRFERGLSNVKSLKQGVSTLKSLVKNEKEIFQKLQSFSKGKSH